MTARRIVAAAGAASAALSLCAFAAPSQSALSPDGRSRAVVDNLSSDQEDGPASVSVLRIEPVGGGVTRVLFRGGPAGQDVKENMHNFEGPRWSLDGGYVYVSAGAWATSPAVHQVDVRTGGERFVVDGGLVGVIREGPYRGMLLVGRHKYWPAPRLGSYDPVDVVRPDGKTMLTVPGSIRDEGERSVARWLKAHGWSAD